LAFRHAFLFWSHYANLTLKGNLFENFFGMSVFWHFSNLAYQHFGMSAFWHVWTLSVFVQIIHHILFWIQYAIPAWMRLLKCFNKLIDIMSALPSSVVFKPAQIGLLNIKDPRQYEMWKVCIALNFTLK
jgi:hypothetical protein